MDRNLGALKTITSKPTAAEAYNYFGVIYQHGRPTPFSGQGIGTAVSTYTSIYTGAGTQITPGAIGGYTQNNTAVSSVKSAIENPNTYYYLNSGGWQWFSVDISLWSDYSTKSKSIYDPCPYGYRVPINGSWTGFTVSHTGAANTIDLGSTWLNTWWPIAGWRNFASGALQRVGDRAYYWSSTRHSSAYYSYYLGFNYSGGVLPSDANYRSYGFSVRCVQEEPQSAKPPNTRLSCFLDFALSGFRFLLSWFGFQAENGVAGGLEYGGCVGMSAGLRRGLRPAEYEGCGCGPQSKRE